MALDRMGEVWSRETGAELCEEGTVHWMPEEDVPEEEVDEEEDGGATDEYVTEEEDMGGDADDGEVTEVLEALEALEEDGEEDEEGRSVDWARLAKGAKADGVNRKQPGPVAVVGVGGGANALAGGGCW